MKKDFGEDIYIYGIIIQYLKNQKHKIHKKHHQYIIIYIKNIGI